MELKESKVEMNEIDDEEVVDILECSNEIEVSECNDDDDTDDVCSSSSSFSGTVSEHDDETDDQTASNDQEADSLMMSTNADAAASLPFLVRKKKLTDHWRRFIHPITWRCKWLELRIKELQNQAHKYDKELQESSCQTKQTLSSSEEPGVKALSPPQKTRLKKRKKRKRVEEASDVSSSYAFNHNLFSYHENRKYFADVSLNDKKNYKREEVFCEETTPLEFRLGDAFLEHILLKIEAVKVRARNLQNRVDKLVNENPSRLSLEQPEEPVKSALVSSHHNGTQSEDEEETTDVLLSEMMSSRQREGKAIVPGKKQEKTEQTLVGEGPSRPVRNRKPRNLDVEVKEEIKTKRRRVSKEKPKSNATMPSRPNKRPNRKRKRGKRRSGSAGSRRRS